MALSCTSSGTRHVPMWGVQQYWAAVELAQCCGYFLSLLLALLSGVVLTCLVTHFLPHLRTLFYLEGTCTVVKTVYTVQYSCGCAPVATADTDATQTQLAAADGTCHSAFYPCLLVYVLINSSSSTHEQLDRDTREQLRWPVLAYEDDWQQINVFRSDEGREERCTKAVCAGGTRTNRDVIERYRIEMAGLGQHQQCWFDPANLLHKGAVFRRNISWTFTFHVLFWPVLFLLAGVAVFLLIFCVARTGRPYADDPSKESESMSGSDTVIMNMEKY